MVNHKCIYKDSQVEIHTSAHRNLLYRSMTALPPVLSPSSILLLSFPQRETQRSFKKCYFIFPFKKKTCAWNCVTCNCLIVDRPDVYRLLQRLLCIRLFWHRVVGEWARTAPSEERAPFAQYSSIIPLPWWRSTCHQDADTNPRTCTYKTSFDMIWYCRLLTVTALANVCKERQFREM
jgi:hypothetical protein